MKALISPNEILTDYQGNTGERIVQIEPDGQTFEVASPLFWSDCPDDCEPNMWWYHDNVCQPMPQPPAPPEPVTPTAE